ncbi:MAG: GNAT family N-acetyltransferase [Rickettsiales bacterium]|jgi:ribosomal-protein-serine acetyltransferase|nr:GNAT family N-acetyltransferase [Rickettsiales bacterium]
MIEFPKIIDGGDIQLVKLEPTFSNAATGFALVDANRAYLAEWLEWVDSMTGPEFNYDFLKKIHKPGNGEYLVLYNGEIVGSCGFVGVNERHKSAEIGYWIASQFSGHGIITRAVKMLERLAFETIGLNRVDIRMDVENIPSENVAKRLDYKFEGILREAFMLRGKSRDIRVYSKLKSEWKE